MGHAEQLSQMIAHAKYVGFVVSVTFSAIAAPKCCRIEAMRCHACELKVALCSTAASGELGRGCVKTTKQFMLSVLGREACDEAVRRG
jgi:hypothetical protein